MRYESDAILAMADGRITHFGPASQVAPQLPPGTAVQSNGRDTLMLPGFIDCHVHYPQIGIIGAHGEQLLDWLNKYTFVAEQKFADAAHARETARVFLKECLRAGTTTAAVFCTVHPQSVDAFFEESSALNMRMIAGKVLMDRNAPAALTDTAKSGYDQSKALIAKWHGRGRQLYAVTPRFAASSTPEQMDMAGQALGRAPRHLAAVACVGKPRRGGVDSRVVSGAPRLPGRLRSLQTTRAALHLRPRHLAQ